MYIIISLILADKHEFLYEGIYKCVITGKLISFVSLTMISMIIFK